MDNDGNFGIGTRDPKARLHVAGDVKVEADHTLEFGAGVPGKEINAGRIGYQVFSADALDIVGAGVQGGQGRKLQFWAESGADFNGPVSATSFANASDRNLKENFAPVNPREVLAKVAGLAVSRWNFKGDAVTSHVGPMAQDFHAAFGLGTDDRHIATVDADGVALAAIQGLNQKVDEKDARIL